ncbi:MAG: alanine--tRNA ligase [Candidatus Neomarinimicrobiota bacterium]
MKAKEVRQTFIDFFKERDHASVRSSSLIPRDDPSLLFTNAGMNQFKNVFLGKEKAKHPRLVNSQKCIRVSGKHNDLEDVGYDAFHHTFFEMLGNWSFGDYYKEEAIRWAWELMTEVWQLPKDRLWATVYEKDDEAAELWKKVTDIEPERVLRFGKKDNFWEMGETGPCGPCSEIHYYVGEDVSKQDRKQINASPQYWELWNLVFIQNNLNPDGSVDDLPLKHVDTGAGLERITAVLQNKTSDYETDLFQPLTRRLEEITTTQCEDHPVAYRAITDHARMLSFAIADGVLPSNEGRGHVSRRILRRAARFGRELGFHEPFLYRLAETVIEEMGEVYPELVERKAHVEKVLEVEEIKFNETLDRGLEQFERITENLSGETIPGEDAFRLYDTYGFPLDLTKQMAKEKGLGVETAGFEREMTRQRERARSEARFSFDPSLKQWTVVTEGDDSEFLGYTDLSSESFIRRYQESSGHILVVLDKTPFYGEQGGQVGDTGILTGDGFRLEVTDTVKDGDTHIHVGTFLERAEITSERVTAQVEGERRKKITLNHTATHLLHRALKLVLGDHVQQAGSLVGPDYLRFDFTHYEKVSPEELRKIEDIVNREIRNNTELDISVRDFHEAREGGAVAIFEEKYGAQVRVISIGDFSKELCGGVHVKRTGDIGFFKITEESSLASGVRRLFAVTGVGAVEHVARRFESLSKVRELLNAPADEIVDRVVALLEQRKKLEKDLKKRRSSGGGDKLARMLKESREVGNHRILVSRVEEDDLDHLKQVGDHLIEVLGSGIGVLGTSIETKPSLVCVVSPDLVREGIRADDLAKSFGKKLGGGGGGKPHLATAGGKNSKRLDTVLREILDELTLLLKGTDV